MIFLEPRISFIPDFAIADHDTLVAGEQIVSLGGSKGVLDLGREDPRVIRAQGSGVAVGRRRRLGEFRVAVWASSPLCRIDTSVSDLFDRALGAIARAGATVDDAARPGIGYEEHHRLFMLLLRAAPASRMRDEDFSLQQEIAATLADDDISDRAAVARGATLLHRAWGSANEVRTKLRYTWHEFWL